MTGLEEYAWFLSCFVCKGHDHCVDGLSSGFLDRKYSLRGDLLNHLEREIHPNNLNTLV